MNAPNVNSVLDQNFIKQYKPRVHEVYLNNGVTFDMAQDFSAAPEIFQYNTELDTKLNEGESFFVSSLVVFIEDTGSFDTDAYGNAITVTNGIKIRSYHGSGSDEKRENNFTPTGMEIRTNTDWLNRSNGGEVPYTFGSGAEAWNVVIDFEKIFGFYGYYCKCTKDRIEFELNDDFSGLLKHNVKMTGFIAKDWIHE